MANWMKSTKTWLGLGSDPYFEDDDVEHDYEDDGVSYIDEPVGQPDRPAVRAVPPTHSGSSAVVSSEDRDDGDGGVRVIHAAKPESADKRGVVRPLPSASKPFVVSPTGFNDVQVVADKFKHDVPVIVNMQGLERELSRRLIDFSSGLCYGLEGDMERVADHVFLLTPRGAEVSDDDRRRIREGGLPDQSH